MDHVDTLTRAGVVVAVQQALTRLPRPRNRHEQESVVAALSMVTAAAALSARRGPGSKFDEEHVREVVLRMRALFDEAAAEFYPEVRP